MCDIVTRSFMTFLRDLDTVPLSISSSVSVLLQRLVVRKSLVTHNLFVRCKRATEHECCRLHLLGFVSMFSGSRYVGAPENIPFEHLT